MYFIVVIFNTMNMKTSFKDLLNLLITFSSYQTFIIRNNFTIYSLSLNYCKKYVEPKICKLPDWIIDFE